MKKRITAILTVVLMIVSFSICMLPNTTVYAEDETDEILAYDITVDVNEDATLNINYHVEWKVLESDENGPVTWVKIGIPNSHVKEYEALSDNIEDINIDSSGETYAEIYFDKEYYQDEVISFDFQICQDYMYQVEITSISGMDEQFGDEEMMSEIDETLNQGASQVEEGGAEEISGTEETSGNGETSGTEEITGGTQIEEASGEDVTSEAPEEIDSSEVPSSNNGFIGTATYYFTPGWFDEINVDEMSIRWNCDKATSWTPTIRITTAMKSLAG